MNIIKDALGTLNTLDEPGKITDLPYEWGEDFTHGTGGSELPADQRPPGR